MSLDRRKALAALLASTVAPWAFAQPRHRPRVVGYLAGDDRADGLAKALAELGYVEGRNLRIQVRVSPGSDAAGLAEAAAELVAARPDALAASFGARVAALAAATRTIPIVSLGVPDPVGSGFARTLRRPGGNITGLSWGIPETAEIVVSLLRTLKPRLRRIAWVHGEGTQVAYFAQAYAAPTGAAGIEIAPAAAVSTVAEVERALAPLAGEAIFIPPFRDRAVWREVTDGARRHRIASVGAVQLGALLNYGLEHDDALGRAAAILDKVLRGADPAEIPFELPQRSVFAMNRTTARAIGIEVPPDMLMRVTHLVD